MKHSIAICLLSLFMSVAALANNAQFSTAGFYCIDNSGRTVESLNPAWRYFKGDVDQAFAVDFDDSNWQVVSLPHSVEYLPQEASGCVNYQGVVWYRKHFVADSTPQNTKQFIHFEAIMGKSKIYLNGALLKEHFGGFLPVIIDVTNRIEQGRPNVIAVCADNSDDPLYPPGKTQQMLDFAYFGGIYRDCWLITHNSVYITDPNFENQMAGGGLFVSYADISEASADVNLKLHIANESAKPFGGVVEYQLCLPNGKQIATVSRKISVAANRKISSTNSIKVSSPQLWSPETPTLYDLYVKIIDNKGNVVDGYRRRIGIRSIEFKGSDGFWLNGKPYDQPLIGANRHQDFAIVGNALSNSLHWRDAKKLRDAGLKVIRNAHYPQDPAFMDACDELGLFVIVNTPGWQFWNEEPIFAQRVYQDIANMVRRDRNHPSVWMWEPILNETYYADDFAKNAHDVVAAEYPYPYCYSGCDAEASGSHYFAVLFEHPNRKTANQDKSKSYFTREWGDYVDDWSSHNSPSRTSRAWGENPMLIQAQHYAKSPYDVTTYDELYRTTPQHVGGCLWHSFDHQRGYHPDPFYGGIMDAFRQPKYSYYMFQSQRSPLVQQNAPYESGPMVYIAHQMSPFSFRDVTVYSNCDQVRLTVNKDGQTYLYQKPECDSSMPSPIITFKDVFDFSIDREKSLMQSKPTDIYLKAEAMMEGKVVATHIVEPARRPVKLLLWCDDSGVALQANGSDLVTVVAAIADERGNIRRLSDQYIRFAIEGEGRLVGDESIMANPAPVRWGTAAILVQSTTNAGKIKISASMLKQGAMMPLSAELVIESHPSSIPLVFSQEEASKIDHQTPNKHNIVRNRDEQEIERLQKEINLLRIKEVERQQADFGEKK